MEPELRLAVLIDAENFSSKHVKKLFDEIAEDGHASIRRVYGGWDAPQLRPWKKVMETYSISTRQECCYSSGKSASDSAMIIDAMDILYTDVVDGFCIASSDGDFTNLARRLREAGKFILGAGENKTPKAFVNSCNRFIYVDLLDDDASPEDDSSNGPKAENAQSSKKDNRQKDYEDNAPSKVIAPTRDNSQDDEIGPTPLEAIKSALIKYFEAKASLGSEKRAHLSAIGNYLRKKHPDFDCRNYKCKTLAQFIKRFDEFDIEEQPSEGDPRVKTMYVVCKKSNGDSKKAR